jgi:hypothetical protein
MSLGAARDVMDGLTAQDLRHPRIDRAAVELALGEFLDTHRQARRPVTWFDDPIEARSFVAPFRTYPAYVSDRSASHAALFDAVWETVDPPRGRVPPLSSRLGPLRFAPAPDEPGIPERLVELIRQLEFFGDPELAGPHPPMSDMAYATRPSIIKAFAAGLFRFRVLSTAIACVARPAIWIVERRLHREDGPAIAWAGGRRTYFWRGGLMDSWLFEYPERVTADMILRTRNSEIRRWMIERFGSERFVRESRARLIAQDRYGKLWRILLPNPVAPPMLMVEVENGTCEPDGTRRRYFLRVPPEMRTAHEAVAWTFGLTPERYAIAMRT